jgi:transcriptional regulator PpsR
LGALDADTAATLIGAVADIALILDPEGVIRDVAFGSEELAQELPGKWLGKRWGQVVTVESRPKIDELLAEAAGHTPSRWRHVNHPASGAVDVPILYCAVPVGPEGRIVAVGRDLRAMASLQQRLIEAQQSMERDYGRLRHMETRYRILFQTTAEAVLLIDASSQKIVEANPAAGELLGDAVRRVPARAFPEGFDADGSQAIQSLLSTVRATGRPDEARARLADGKREVLVSASLFRQDNLSFLLVRLAPLAAETSGPAVPKTRSKLLELAERAPDGFVVTDRDGRVVAANLAFLDLVQLVNEEQARGESLERWLGRPGVDLNVLLANLRQHGSVKLFATTLRGEYAASAEIEVSAVTLTDGEQPSFGFLMRNVGRRLPADVRTGRELPRSVEQMTDLVGRVPLKDLVRETTDVIERLCIEAALELTGDNRASAAEILGLSRQSLYVKLRRYGLGDLGSEAEE